MPSLNLTFSLEMLVIEDCIDDSISLISSRVGSSSEESSSPNIPSSSVSFMFGFLAEFSGEPELEPRSPRLFFLEFADIMNVETKQAI